MIHGKKSGDRLKPYKKKRNLRKSPEPRAHVRSTDKNNLFVIQKHDSSHLHYDFRLEVDGVLASWAVPKGLSKTPNEKRLAVQTEDHPLEYAEFEGVIPEGQYGAGTVKIWDKGTYQLLEGKTVAQNLKDGTLKFILKGKKYSGIYALVRVKRLKANGKEQWLIFKVAKNMKANNIQISHPEKILSPKDGISKADVAAYYERIAPFMLPHIKDRPLTLRRYPDGIEKEGFYNKHAPDYFPDLIKRINVPMHSEKGKIAEMASADEASDLVYFANQNMIEIHMGLSTARTLEKPNQIIFDFDPSDNDFEKVRIAALELENMLDELGLPSFVKTTGSRGVHVHIPIKPERKFAAVKDYARSLAQHLNDMMPDITTLEHRKDKRGDRVFIDYLRNDYAMTAIAPYSLRAKKGAPVATPIMWEELSDLSLKPNSFTIENIFKRLAKNPDPWKDFRKTAVRLK